MKGDITASIWEMCDNEAERLGTTPGLFRILDICEPYGYEHGTICTVYYRWRKSQETTVQTELELGK
jgi:hypothetical protein